MTPPLDLATARRLAAEVVEAQGRDFVYNPDGGQQCLYRPLESDNDGDPRRLTGCLVGRILDAWGETRHRDERAPIRELVMEDQALEGAIEPAALDYLDDLQYAQDGGASWGSALEIADSRLESRSKSKVPREVA